MGIKKGLRRHWIDSDPIRDRIDGRIYAGRIPDKGKLPCVVIQVVSTTRHYHVGGESGITESIVQVDVWGESITEVDEIAELIRNRTSGYNGTAGDETIRVGLIVREGDTTDQPKDGSGKWIYRHSRDFQVFYTTTVPTLA